jgi:hypothetical protein
MPPIGRAEVLFYAQLDVVGGLCSLDAPAFFAGAISDAADHDALGGFCDAF